MSKKHPKAPLLQPTEKRPKSAPAESYFNLRPAWRVSRLEVVDPFGWHLMPVNKLHEVRAKLGQFETRTWGEGILRSNRDHHFMPVEKICPEAQQRLRNLGLDDTDALFSLRLSARERVWGILDNGILLLLWWDPFHQIYPVELRNT